MVETLRPDSREARPQPAVFEYSRPAFHAIQEMVRDGCRKKGGEERAGVLYGTHEGNIVRVQAARRIECEHARGRTLLLSANDTTTLKKQLTEEAAEPALQGLAVVGWFLSHTAPIRTAMTASGRTVLSSADLKTFGEYFGTPGQITLVLRPHASATMQASVFVRRADKSVNAEDSDLDFPFTESAAFPDSPKGIESKCPHPSAPAVHETALAAAAATKAATVSVPTARQTVPARTPASAPSAEPTSTAPAAPSEPTAPPLAPAAAALLSAEPVAPAKKNTSAVVSSSQSRIPELEPAADPAASAKPVASVKPATPLAAAGGCHALQAIRVARLPDLKAYPNFGSSSHPAPRFTFQFAKFFEGPGGIVRLVLLAGLALMPLGVRYYRSQVEPVPISLTLSERDRQIQVRWNHSSSIIREAVQGSIEIVDGKESRSAALSADDLSRGNITYMRQTGDVQIRLEVENAKGQKAQEVVHFIERLWCKRAFTGR